MQMCDDPSSSRTQARGPEPQLNPPPPIPSELDKDLRQCEAARFQGAEAPTGLSSAATPTVESSTASPSQPKQEVTDAAPSASPSQPESEVTVVEPTSTTVEAKPSSPTAAELEAEEQAFLKAFASLPAKRVMSDEEKKVRLPLKELLELLELLKFRRSFPHLEVRRLEVSDSALEVRFDRGELALEGFARTDAGRPKEARDVTLTCVYQVQGESGERRTTAVTVLSITPNPRNLWQNKPTDKAAEYWTPDEENVCVGADGRTIIAASKRGRSHAHVGSFRDDSFKVDYLSETGWHVVAVSDGAGSAEFSRAGSRIICSTFCELVRKTLTDTEAKVREQGAPDTADAWEPRLRKLVPWAAQKGALAISAEAQAKGRPIKTYAATFLGYVMKRLGEEWLVVSIGIGDGIIGMLRRDEGDVDELVLLSEPDGGEYVGQTRFVTMAEVWEAKSLERRVKSARARDFRFIMSMTDGVSDPKFETDSNLGSSERWDNLWRELECRLPLSERSEETSRALLGWLDFWSVGNHDDRTIAIVY